MIKVGSATVLGAAFAALPARQALAASDTDLVVYGATAAGLMAGIQAARMGCTVVVVEPGSHVGGMTTGGLGNTDIGAPDAVGGLAAEFYRRIGQQYGITDGSPWFTFEPSVAASVLGRMAADAGLAVRTNARLRSVNRAGNRIVSLTTVDGLVFTGRMFIDASYEGDLMAAAGVTCAAGREANSQYGETLNGVQLQPKLPHEASIDPYVVAGNKSSGLLPGIAATPLGGIGTADGLTQAYTFRLCLTQAPDRIRFTKPRGYDPAAYELLRRYIDKGNTGPFFYASPVGGGKYDVNNLGPYSTDWIGQNHAYPAASWTQRDAIAAAHRTYQQGLLWFLANDTRLPAAVRSYAASWGLAPDEFTATGGWSPQLYVRESRRMRSDYVMIEPDFRGRRVAADPVGLASYTMDAHSTQRVVVDGEVRNEGWLQATPPGPYPISFRSIVPRQSECVNLAVPVCLSASHAAYASIRMEPVFMILGQSAATAAVLALRAGTAIQQVPYPTLSARLTQDQQVLAWPPLPPGDIVVDNANYTGTAQTGNWNSSAGVAGYFGADFLISDRPTPWANPTFRFTPTLPKAGRYTVYLRWAAASNRASAVPVDIISADGTVTKTVNQQVLGGKWVPLGTFSFAAGTSGSVLIRAAHTDGFVVADAVRFSPA